ncbi:UNVERIFIED_CONTAM: hypothetical protein FKN15_073639 [Acipenser sinensis]
MAAANKKSPSTKKVQRFCSFRDEWLEMDDFKACISKDHSDATSARCIVCHTSFTVKHDDVSAVKTHQTSDRHKLAFQAQKSSDTLSNFFVKKNTEEEDSVIASEISLVYHGVTHHHSYLSQDCGNKLYAKVFPDSKITKKLYCGRTKIYTNMKNENGNLLTAACNCHLLHNAAKHACKRLAHDVESFVIKVNNEFSCSAKHVSELKSCFEFLHMGYHKLLRHVPTRWLSLFTAVDRLLKNWPAVKLYFIQQGEESCPTLIWDFVKSQEDGLNPDTDLSVHECYLFFVHSYMNAFQPAILKLESDNTQSTEIFGVLNEMLRDLKSRISECFFGFKVNQALKYLPPSKQEAFTKNALDVYQRSAEYLEKQFNFGPDSYLQKIAILSLKPEATFTFEELSEIPSIFDVHIDGEQLFNGYCILKEALPKLDPDNKLSVDQKWGKFFDKCDAPNLLKTIECAFAIPVSNVFVE